jgi:hypothetical protein
MPHTHTHLGLCSSPCFHTVRFKDDDFTPELALVGSNTMSSVVSLSAIILGEYLLLLLLVVQLMVLPLSLLFVVVVLLLPHCIYGFLSGICLLFAHGLIRCPTTPNDLEQLKVVFEWCQPEVDHCVTFVYSIHPLSKATYIVHTRCGEFKPHEDECYCNGVT